MKKRYPIRKHQKFAGYCISRKDLVTESTVAVDREIYYLILDTINSAKKSVYLAQFQFSLDKKFFIGIPFHIYSSLKSRQAEGCAVKIILNRKFANIYQYALNRRAHSLLNTAGLETKFAPGKTALHSKLIIVDDETAIITSANLTISSLADNHEVAVLVKSELVNKILSPYFFRLWESAS